MATDTDASPVAALDAVMDVTVDDDEIPDAAPAEDEPEASPPGQPDASAEGADGQADQPDEPESPNTPEPEPAAPAEPVADAAAWQPPPGGEPFAFRADGREVQVPGALRYGHGVYVPAEAWPTVQRHLADREALTAQIRQRDQQIAALNPEQHPDVQRSRESLKALTALMDKGPEEVAKWLDNFAVNRPLFEAQVKNATLEAQLQARQRQISSTESEQHVAQLREQLPGYLRQHIDAAVQADPALTELAGLGDKLFEQLWPFAEHLFLEADRDYPELGLKKGQITVRQDVLRRMLTQQAGTRAEIKKLEAAAKQNAAATRPVKAAPTVITRGKPVPGSRSKTYKPGDESWKDDLLGDPLEDL